MLQEKDFNGNLYAELKGITAWPVTQDKAGH